MPAGIADLVFPVHGAGVLLVILLVFPVFFVIFLFIGNYLPKSRRNYTMGIKIPWALNSDDNWNATHRVGGIVYMAIGVICLIMAFIPGLTDKTFWLFFIVMIVGSTIPVAYSYIYYLKNEKDKE